MRAHSLPLTAPQKEKSSWGAALRLWMLNKCCCFSPALRTFVPCCMCTQKPISEDAEVQSESRTRKCFSAVWKQREVRRRSKAGSWFLRHGQFAPFKEWSIKFFLWQQRLHLSCSLGRSGGTTQPSEEGGQLEKACSGCSKEKKSVWVALIGSGDLPLCQTNSWHRAGVAKSSVFLLSIVARRIEER